MKKKQLVPLILSVLVIFIACNKVEINEVTIDSPLPNQVTVNTLSNIGEIDFQIEYVDKKIAKVNNLEFSYENNKLSRIQILNEDGSPSPDYYSLSYSNNRLSTILRHSTLSKLTKITRISVEYNDDFVIMDHSTKVGDDQSFKWLRIDSLCIKAGNILKLDSYPTNQDNYLEFEYGQTSSPFNSIESFSELQILSASQIGAYSNPFFSTFYSLSAGENNLKQIMVTNGLTNQVKSSIIYNYDYDHNVQLEEVRRMLNGSIREIIYLGYPE